MEILKIQKINLKLIKNSKLFTFRKSKIRRIPCKSFLIFLLIYLKAHWPIFLQRTFSIQNVAHKIIDKCPTISFHSHISQIVPAMFSHCPEYLLYFVHFNHAQTVDWFGFVQGIFLGSFIHRFGTE